MFSGWEYRVFTWLIINAVGFTFILLYAKKIKKHPEKSLTYDIDDYWRKQKVNEDAKLTYYTPLSAWISFGILLIVLILFSVFYPISKLSVGNAEFTFAALPVAYSLVLP